MLDDDDDEEDDAKDRAHKAIDLSLGTM